MSDKFNSYYSQHIKWTKFTCDIIYWFIVGILASIISEYYFTLDACTTLESEFSMQALLDNSFLNNTSDDICNVEITIKSWIAAWVISTIIRSLFLIWQGGPLLKAASLRLTRLDGKKWTIANALSYSVIEWLPVLMGAAYLFLFNMPNSIFAAGVHSTIVIGAQLIWVAPIIFKFKNRNIVETLSGVTLEATEKKHKKIEKSYNKKFKRNLNLLSWRLNSIFYILITSFLIFLFIQILRIPDQNPNYQEALYGGYNPTWEDNTYFAMEGLSAPANVSDYIQYGMKKSYEYFKIFREMQRLSGVDKKYLNELPEMSEFTVTLDKENELKIDSDEWKNLHCLFDLEEEKNEECATYDDWKNYISQNQIMWKRFNNGPKHYGTHYNTPPQLLGSKIQNPIQLSQLKAVHIVYLAENGDQNEAMEQWLIYMNLYRNMAENRETTVFKALLAINIGMHLNVLEKILNIAPNLAETYEEDILKALRSNKPIFREAHMIADNWGLIEPFSFGLLGNANAVQNDFYKCIEGFQALAETPHDKYPFDQDIILCPYEEREGAYQYLTYPLMQPGSPIINSIYNLLFSSALKGHELIGNMKVNEVKMRQAQLATKILSNKIPADKISDFVKTVPDHLQNPITNEPFNWNGEEKYLFFYSPYNKTMMKFQLNIE